MTRIELAPQGEGWRLSAETLAGDLLFARGAAAEAAARRLAQAFADAGEIAELRIVLRDGSLAERRVYAGGLDLAPQAA